MNIYAHIFYDLFISNILLQNQVLAWDKFVYISRLLRSSLQTGFRRSPIKNNFYDRIVDFYFTIITSSKIN